MSAHPSRTSFDDLPLVNPSGVRRASTEDVNRAEVELPAGYAEDAAARAAAVLERLRDL